MTPAPENPPAFPVVEQVARAIDAYAFHRFKDGDVLPRGAEFSTAAKENQIQGFRQRKAESQARKALKVIDELLVVHVVRLLEAAEAHDKAAEAVVNGCDEFPIRLEELEENAKTAWEHYELAKDDVKAALQRIAARTQPKPTP